MNTTGPLFPKRLSLVGIVFLSLVLGFGLYSTLNSTRLLNSFQARDVPALQLSCASTRLMSETQGMLSSPDPDLNKVRVQFLVLDQSLQEMLSTMEDFPEGKERFEKGSSYQNFLKIIDSKVSGQDEKKVLLELKDDAQTLIEEYLHHKSRLIEDNIFFGNLAITIIIIGVVLFFLLLYAVYRRYQQNLDRLSQLTKILEQERMANIQSSKLASLGEMAAGLAHEINNPLAVIMGRAEILMDMMSQENASPLEMNKNLGKIQEMSVRISKIVTSMRKVSKGDGSGELTMIQLGEVLEDILNLCSQRMKNKSIELIYDHADAVALVKSNFTQLSQVIINIMNNAIDELNKCPEDNRKIHITVDHLQDRVVLKIADSGEGIPAAVREKIFQPFFTTKDVGEGTGLGLSISRSLMQGMGGNLTLSEGPETCFLITIPRG